jgi:hypothetical protein
MGLIGLAAGAFSVIGIRKTARQVIKIFLCLLRLYNLVQALINKFSMPGYCPIAIFQRCCFWWCAYVFVELNTKIIVQ